MHNTVDLGAGNDTVLGSFNGGNYSGGAGNDSLSGGSGGADTLLGGDGNDTLRAWSGSDSMSGGTGADLFLFIKGDGKDTISDFNIAVDKLSFGSSITYQDLSFTMDTVNGVKGVTVHYSPVDIVFLQGVTSTHLPQSDFMFT